MPKVTVPFRNHLALDSAETSELMGEDLDSLLDKELAAVKAPVSLEITVLAR